MSEAEPRGEAPSALATGIAAPAGPQPTLTLEQFQMAVNETFVPLHISSEHPERFRAAIASAGSEDIHFSDVRASAHLVRRTDELIARSSTRFLKLSLQIEGRSILHQDGREAILDPGDFGLYDTGRPYTLAFSDEFRVLVLMFPRELLELPPESIAQLTGVRIAGDTALARVLTPFIISLSESFESFNSQVGRRVAHSVIDLITTMFGSEIPVHSGGAKQKLLTDIFAYIDAHLADPDLGPGQIAGAFFVSVRRLHSLFHEQGSTVSAWIRARRLERCRRELQNTDRADRPVAEIAASWGFADAAHFSRVFRASFGQSPSSVRQAALAERTP